MKFCRDCKHAIGSSCESPNNFVDNVNTAKYLVTGIEQPVERIRLGSSCQVLRQYERHPGLDIPLCGPEGIWFEPDGAA